MGKQTDIDRKFKRKAVKKAMTDYYKTINQGKFALPSFLLAAWAIKKTKAYDRVDELYEKLDYLTLL